MNESSFDVSRLWRSQSTAGVVMAAEEMRRRAVRSKAKERRERAVRVGAASVWGLTAVMGLMLQFPDPLRVWINGIQFAAIVTWFVFSGPQAFERPVIDGLHLTARVGVSSCLDFYRRELIDRRERLRRNFKAIPMLGAFAVAFILIGASHRELAVVFGSLTLVVLVMAYIRLRREYPGVQRELDELDAFRAPELRG